MTMQANVNVNARIPPGASAGVSGEAGLANQLPAVSPANVPPLPTPGDLTGQFGQGNAVFRMASGAMQNLQSGGDPVGALSNLLGAGITLAAGQSQSTAGKMIRSVVSIGTATASGAAVGGPFGAAAGIVIGTVQTMIQGIFGSGPPVFQGMSVDSTPGSERLYGFVVQWGQSEPGALSGYPQGASFAGYLTNTRKPSDTPRRDLFWHYAQLSDGSDYGMAAVGQGQTEAVGNPGNTSWPPSHDGEDAFWSATFNVAIPLFWQWAQPPNQNAAQSQAPGAYAAYFAQWSTPPGESQWLLDTSAVLPTKHGPGLSKSQIMQSALHRAPDPGYFSSDLYVQNWLSGGADGITILNTETLAGLATVLGMLAVGASTRAIAFELEQQQMTLGVMNQQPSSLPTLQVFMQDQTFSSTYTPADAQINYKQMQAQAKLPTVPPLFRQLVEDYVLLAHLEEKDPKATMADVLSQTANDAPTYILDLLRKSHTTSYLGQPIAKATPVLSPQQEKAQEAAQKAQDGRTIAHFVQLYLS